MNNIADDFRESTFNYSVIIRLIGYSKLLSMREMMKNLIIDEFLMIDIFINFSKLFPASNQSNIPCITHEKRKKTNYQTNSQKFTEMFFLAKFIYHNRWSLIESEALQKI